MSDYNGYDDTDDEDDDRLRIPATSTEPDQQWTPPPSAALVNPVIRNFDTPAQASSNTVPAAPPASTNRPTAPPSDDPSPAPSQPQAAPADAARTPQTSPSSATNAAPAPQVQPQAAAPVAQPAPAAADDTDGSDSTPTATAPTDPFAANAQLYKQFQQDQANQLRYLKSQGGQTEVLPTGAEVPKQDADGNQLYHPGVVNPLTTLDDGRAYKVLQDQYGNQKYMDILSEGQEGRDFHTDQNTGEQFVQTQDGRQTIGQDAIIPAMNDLKGQYQAHSQNVAQANLDIAQAENGTQGGGPLAASSLSDLRDRASQLKKDLKPLAEQLDSLSSYTDDSADPSDITQKKQVAAQVQFKQNLLDQVQGEVDSRDSIIGDARQRRDASAQQRQDAINSHNVLSQIRQSGGLDALRSDLTNVAGGGALNETRYNQLQNLGLLRTEPNGDGTQGTTARVTPAGLSMLDSDTQASIQKNPDQFAVTDADGTPLPHLQAASGKLTQLGADNAPDGSAATASGTPPKPSATAPARQDTTGTAASAGAGQSQQKPYAVAQDGTVKFDQANPTAAVLEAYKDGAIDAQTAQTSIQNAKKVEAAHGALTQFLQDHPQVAAAAEGLSTGGAFVGGGKLAVAGATASGINPAILAASSELGPFAWVPPALASAGEFVGGGLLASWAKKKAEQQLGQYTDAVQALQNGAKAYPKTAATAQFLPMLPEAVASVGGFARIGGVAADDLGATATTGQKIAAGATAIGKQAAVGAAGGAAIEGIVRPALSYSADAVLDAAGIKHDPTEAPTVGSVIQMAGLGALTAGAGVGVDRVSDQQMGSILIRGAAHEKDKVPFHEVIPADQVAARYGQYPNMSAQDMANIGQPLTPAEQELYTRAMARMNELKQTGQLPSRWAATAQQATRGGAPIGVTSFDFRPRGSGESSGDAPSTNPPQLSGGQNPAPTDQPSSSIVPPAPAPSAPPAPRVFPANPAGTSSASPASTAPPAAGQASTGQPDDRNQATAGPQVISSASFADVAGQPGQPSTQAALAQRTQALNAQMQVALGNGQRVDMVRVGSDGTETRQQISRAPDGRMLDESGNTVRAGAALTPDTRFEITPPAVAPVVQNPPAPSDQTSAASSPAADPAVAKMIQTRDDAQKLLDAGKVSPEAEETTRGLVDQLSRQISAAQAGQRPPAAPAQTSSPTPASPAGDSAASASNAPAPAGSAGPRPPAGSAEGSSSAVPAPRASGSSQSEAGASPSGEGSTPTAAHQALAEAANAGADTQAPGQAPTPTFAALKFLKKVGADVTPELARDVDAKVQAITTDPTLDVPGKTAALKQLVLDTAAKPPTSKAPAAPAENGPNEPGNKPDSAAQSPEPSEPTPFHKAAPVIKEAAMQRLNELQDAGHEVPDDLVRFASAPVDRMNPAAQAKFLADAQEYEHNTDGDLGLKQRGVILPGDTADPDSQPNGAAGALDSYAKDGPVSTRRGSTQLTLSPEDAKPFQNFARNLPESIIHSVKDPATGEEQYGRETEPHVTALYGLHGSGDDPAAVAAAVQNHGPVKLRVGKLSVFSNPDADYDVLKADIHSPALHALNGRLRGLEHSSGYPDYKPHLTLAYLKKGEGARFVGREPFAGKELTFSHLTHSPADKAAGRTQIPLGTADDGARQATKDAAQRGLVQQAHDALAGRQARGEALSPQEANRLANAKAFLSRSTPGTQEGSGSRAATTPPTTRQTPAASTATERQPVTAEGKQAKTVVDALTARKAEQNGFLKPGDQTSLAEAREAVDRDLNRQVLGDNPQPATDAGKAALKRIQFLDQARDAGAALPPSDHASRVNAARVLERDFTAQRQAIETKQAQPTAATDGTNAPPPAAPTFTKPPAAQKPAATFRKNEEVTFKGRRGVVEEIDGDKALVRLKAGTSPTNPSVNLVASRLRVPLAALEKPPKPGTTAAEPGNTSASQPASPAKPIDPYRAADTARKLVAANREMLGSLGVRDVKYGGTQAGSGIEIGDDGTLHLDIPRLAKSMATVRDNQASRGIESTPEDWFAQVLAHEGIHAADAAVARAKGQTLQQRYEALPAEAMPEGWQAAGRDVYGAKNWDALPEWKQKAEFVRQVVEGKWTGRLTEALYKFIQDAIDYLKSVAGFKNADPRFKAHVEEVESRIETARQSAPAQPTYRAGGRATYGRRAATIQAIDGDTATIQLKGSKTPVQVPVADLKPPVARRFVLPSTATGQPDVIDHIAENGGMRGSVAGKRIAAGKGIDVAGDYDDRPNLKGVYQNAVFGGQMTPDQMASLLHEDHGIGDGSVGGMYGEIERAMQARGTARTEMQRQATEQKQADRFDRDATEQATAKGAQAVNTSDLNVGDKVQVGDQTLKVIGVDPDTMDVTLEDHSKYGVQTVADGQKLYVEKVEPGSGASGDQRLAAARPDRDTADLFGGDDDPFNLRGELASAPERVAAAKEAASRPPAPVDDRATAPTLRSGEKGTGDLFQGEDQPFNLAGETAIDHAARQRAQEQDAQNKAEALAKEQRDQNTLFAAAPDEAEPSAPLSVRGQNAQRIVDGITAREQAGHPINEGQRAHRAAMQRVVNEEQALARQSASQPEANQPGREQTPDPNRVASIKDLVDEATGPGATQGRRYAEYGTVSPEQAAQLKSDTGLDLEGYHRNLDNMAVRHVLKNHGDPAAEIARGNLPLSPEDFERLPDALAHPDASIHAGKNRFGQDVILHAKRVNGHYIVAEEVRAGRRVLNLSTLYKKSAPPLASDSGQGPAPLPTPEAIQSTARRTLEQIVAQHNFLRGRGGSSLAAAEPEPVDEAGVKPAVLANPMNRKAVQQSWKKLGTRSPMFKNWFGDWEKAPADASKVVAADGKPLVVYHGSPELPKGGFDTFRIPKDAGDLLAGTGVYLTDSKKMGQSYTLNRDALLSGGPVDAGNVPDSTPVLPLYANIRKPFPAGAEGLPAVRDILAKELPDDEFKLPARPGRPAPPPVAQVKAEQIDNAIQNMERTYGSTEPLLAYRALKEVLSDYGQMNRYGAGDPVRDVLERHGFDGIAHEGGVMGGQKHNVFVAFDPTQVKSAEPAGSPRSNSGAFDRNNPSMLAAAEPEDADELASSLFGKAASTSDPAKKGSFVQRARDEIAKRQAQSKLEDMLSAHHDAVDTMAGEAGLHAKSGIGLDIPNPLDRQAAGPVVEAGYDPRKLAADLARVKASPNPKLAKQYAPIYQRALDNLPRLREAAAGWRQRDLAEDAAAEQAGLTPQWQARTKHIYDDPTAPESTVAPDKGFGATKGFKTAADAIAAGVDPKSTDLGDLAERRVAANRRAINEHAFQNELASLKATDGQPMVKSIEENGTKLNAAGDPVPSARVPAGYKAVQAGNNVIVAHKEIAPFLDAIYGDSAVADHWLGKHLTDLAALAKHATVGIDSYHGCQTAMRSILGFQVANWRAGLAGRDFADADLDRAVKAGKITQKDADEARANRALDNGLLAEGLNVGKVSDNLLDAARQHNLITHIPVLGHAAAWVNKLTFHAIQPGYMRQAARIAYARNKARFPEMSEQELLRKSAKEVNEFYGNLGSQGFLKSKTMQDLAKLTLFAPGFTEGRFRTEARGIGQAAQVPVDVARGKGFRVGVVAQAMAGIVMASLIGNQMLNLFSRGHSTFQNPEEGHKFDAWIPGGPNNRGFWFSPLAIAAEYSHELLKYMGGGQSALDAAAHIGSNKLSGTARALKDLLTGTDASGHTFGSMGERLKAAATDALPLPFAMQLSPWLQKNPKSPLGYGLNHEPGAGEKQLLASAGLRVDAAPSARSQMYRVAQPFRADHGGASHAPSAYSDLRRMLDQGDLHSASGEIGRLVREEGKSVKDISKAMGIRKDGSVKPEMFTGSHKAEERMKHSLTPEQRKAYVQAQREHTQIGMRFKAAAARRGAPVPAGA